MSWFSGSSTTLDAEIEKATSEAIPFGETDLATSLEITDLIRSKQVDSKEAMRSLKKRLTSTKNPNTQLSTLHLIDTCVKNGGNHFIVEISSREFIDSLVSLIHGNKTHEPVKVLALELVQNWAIAFKENFQFKYLHKVYSNLKDDGYDFPPISNEVSSTLFDSNAPPEWEDSDACMICSTKFSMINRKHHCRNCGGVYCQAHSSENIALPQLGITEPARVCDTCYDEVKHKSNKGKGKRTKHQQDVSRARAQYDSDDNEDLKRALELSLKESQSNAYSEPPKPETSHIDIAEEDDEDMRAAIAASLREMELQQQLKQQQQQFSQQPAQDNGPYSNIMPRLSTGSVPQYNEQSQAQYQQPLPQQLSPNVTSNEEIDIRTFALKVQEAKINPIQAYDNPELTEAYKRAMGLKPKVSQELNDSFNKYESFMDMNSKLDTIMKLYNTLLDERIEKNNNRIHETYERPQQHTPQPEYRNQPPLQQQYIPQQYAPTSPEQQYQQPYLQAYQQYQNPQPAYQQSSHESYQQSSESQNAVPSTHVQLQGQEIGTTTSTPLYQHDTAVAEAEQRYPPIDQLNELEQPPQQQHQEEEEFSAPPPVLQYQEHGQPSEPNYAQPQAPHQQPEHGPKITDLNFPNVPISKLPLNQDPEAAARFQTVQVAKEETLIEL